MQPVILRPARKDDCVAIARFFLVASDGLAAHVWAQHAKADEMIEAVGAARYAREGTDFSYQNCLVAEDGSGRVVAMAHAYPVGVRDSDRGSTGVRKVEIDPVLAPYAELEEPLSFYLAGLAVEAAWRGRGIGKRLLAATARRGLEQGYQRLSLICFERNVVGLSLYRQVGFVEVDRRPIVPHPCLHVTGGDAVLLAASAAVVERAATVRPSLQQPQRLAS